MKEEEEEATKNNTKWINFKIQVSRPFVNAGGHQHKKIKVGHKIIL